MLECKTVVEGDLVQQLISSKTPFSRPPLSIVHSIPDGKNLEKNWLTFSNYWLILAHFNSSALSLTNELRDLQFHN